MHALVKCAPLRRGRVLAHQRRAKHETNGGLHLGVAPDEVQRERHVVFADQLLGALDGGGRQRVRGNLCAQREREREREREDERDKVRGERWGVCGIERERVK